MFHNNKSLADAQKLHYLKSCVTKSAGDVIKSFPTTGDNYQRAYDALLMRYENKSLTIQSHIRSLLGTQKVITATAAELQKLHHHVISHVKAHVRSSTSPYPQLRCLACHTNLLQTGQYNSW